MGIQEFISYFDAFGETNFLRNKRKNTFQTACGGFLSFFMFLILVAIILYRLFQIFYESPEQITINQRQQHKQGEVLLNKANFMFSIQIVQPDFIANPFYSFRAILESSDQDLKTIELQQCTTDHYPKNQDQFKSLNLQNFLCPFLDYEIQLKETTNRLDFKYLKIQIIECNSRNPCKTIEEKAAYLQTNTGYQVNFYHINYEITRDWTQPYKPFIQSFTNFRFNPVSKFQTVDMIMKNYLVNIRSSLYPFLENLLIGNNQTNFPVVINSQTQMMQDVPGQNPSVFGLIQMRLSVIEEVYDMGFERADLFLAYIGGLFLVIYISLRCILGSYHQNRFLLELAQEQYTTVIDWQKSPLDLQLKPETSFSQKFHTYKKYIQFKKVQVTVTCRYIIEKMCCFASCYSDNVKLQDAVRRKMAVDLDIIEFLDKVKQVRLIKNLLLTQYQTVMIDLLKKKQLTWNQEEKIDKEVPHQDQVNAFLNLLQVSKNYDEKQINNRLLSGLDVILQQILDGEKDKRKAEQLISDPKKTVQTPDFQVQNFAVQENRQKNKSFYMELESGPMVSVDRSHEKQMQRTQKITPTSQIKESPKASQYVEQKLQQEIEMMRQLEINKVRIQRERQEEEERQRKERRRQEEQERQRQQKLKQREEEEEREKRKRIEKLRKQKEDDVREERLRKSRRDESYGDESPDRSKQTSQSPNKYGQTQYAQFQKQGQTYYEQSPKQKSQNQQGQTQYEKQSPNKQDQTQQYEQQSPGVYGQTQYDPRKKYNTIPANQSMDRQRQSPSPKKTSSPNKSPPPQYGNQDEIFQRIKQKKKEQLFIEEQEEREQQEWREAQIQRESQIQKQSFEWKQAQQEIQRQSLELKQAKEELQRQSMELERQERESQEWRSSQIRNKSPNKYNSHRESPDKVYTSQRPYEVANRPLNIQQDNSPIDSPQISPQQRGRQMVKYPIKKKFSKKNLSPFEEDQQKAFDKINDYGIFQPNYQEDSDIIPQQYTVKNQKQREISYD